MASMKVYSFAVYIRIRETYPTTTTLEQVADNVQSRLVERIADFGDTLPDGITLDADMSVDEEDNQEEEE